LVFWTACSSLCTVSLSLLTAARADARFASRVAVLTIEVVGELDLASLVSRSPPLVVCSPVVVAAGEVVVVRLLGDLLGVVAGVVEVGVVAGVVAPGVFEEGAAVVVVGEVALGVVVAPGVVG
jgi:hypothetical protein